MIANELPRFYESECICRYEKAASRQREGNLHPEKSRRLRHCDLLFNENISQNNCHLVSCIIHYVKI